MVKRAWHHLGPILGLLALFVALGGPAWAADKINGSQIKPSTVTSKQVKNSSLKGADVKDSSLTGADVKDGSLTGADVGDGTIGTADLSSTTVAPSALALPGLRTRTDATSPVIIGGPSGNTVAAGASGSVIGGGGAPTFFQVVFDDFGTVAGGRGNTAGSDTASTTDAVGASVGGGEGNRAAGSYSTVPGGLSNTAGDFSLAAGRRAKATTTGSFVWADSTNADFTSTADNQFAIRAANGQFIANDAGGSKVVPVGTRYRDNAIVAWARVSATAGLDSNFNVASVTRLSTGLYRIVLGSSLSSGFSLVPVVTPEVDPTVVEPPAAPVGAANVRFAVTNQVAAGNTFDVYMYNGSFNLVDNDFQVLVTGR